jgi:hypothetical protein
MAVNMPKSLLIQPMWKLSRLRRRERPEDPRQENALDSQYGNFLPTLVMRAIFQSRNVKSCGVRQIQVSTSLNNMPPNRSV